MSGAPERARPVISVTWADHLAGCPTCLAASQRRERRRPCLTLDGLRNASQGRVWRALGLLLGHMEERTRREQAIALRHRRNLRAEGARRQERHANGRFLGAQQRLW